jgi:putative FmdB family regulatory protein
MPSYPYRCPDCRTETDIYKTMDEAGSMESCHACGGVMIRLYESIQVRVPAGGYNRALGCKSLDTKDKLRRIHDETGRSFVEAGNESLDSIKPDLIKYPDRETVLKDYYSTKAV